MTESTPHFEITSSSKELDMKEAVLALSVASDTLFDNAKVMIEQYGAYTDGDYAVSGYEETVNEEGKTFRKIRFGWGDKNNTLTAASTLAAPWDITYTRSKGSRRFRPLHSEVVFDTLTWSSETQSVEAINAGDKLYRTEAHSVEISPEVIQEEADNFAKCSEVITDKIAATLARRMR